MARRLGPVGVGILAALIGQRRSSAVYRFLIAGSPSPRLFLHRALRLLCYRVTVEGIERLPDCAEFIAVSNHPTGGAEGLVLMDLLLKGYGGVRLPANALLQHLRPIAPLCTPVDVFRMNTSRIATVESLIEPGRPLLLFPAGRTARVRGGRLRDFPWRRGFVLLARRSGRPVVPITVRTSQSRLFDVVWRVRRAFGVAVNLEMLLLVREVLRRGRAVHVTIHPPIAAQVLADGTSPRRHARLVQHLVESTRVAAA